MLGHNVASDYVESLNDDYSDVASVCSGNSEVSNSAFTDFAFLLSQQHFFVCSETLRVFMSLSLARYVVSWYGVDDVYSLILNNMAYGFDPFHEDFSLKTFLEQEIIFLDTSSSSDHSSDFSNEPGYQEWVNSPNLNLFLIEVEFLNFLKGYFSDDSDDSIVVESNEISCEYFDGQSVYFSFYIKKASLVPDNPNDQVQEVFTMDTVTSPNDDVDSDFDYGSD
ncbi:hypothetical protein F8M41_019259 [Gigaspora margarita]|uniref:Uncharacterized protein n=1 Tax=Gigaspora margarita TaxID=4874 RepID=A0A8H4EKS5_GIGMA|nr:hypothetical protein F8M41_019259 [Gigaspora margarita]